METCSTVVSEECNRDLCCKRACSIIDLDEGIMDSIKDIKFWTKTGWNARITKHIYKTVNVKEMMKNL